MTVRSFAAVFTDVLAPETIRNGVIYVGGLILSICVHEWGHAFAADRLGDPLPRSEGRVTLNPLAHVDPLGTLFLPIMTIVMAVSNPEIASRILGWGKPVRVSLSPRSISRKISLRTAHVLIAAAGPAMNLLFAAVLSFAYFAVIRWGNSETLQYTKILSGYILMNVGLCFFNLLPLGPLDGGGMLVNLLPRRYAHIGELSEKYGAYVLFGLLMTGLLGYYMLPARLAALHWIGFLTRLGIG